MEQQTVFTAISVLLNIVIIILLFVKKGDSTLISVKEKLNNMESNQNNMDKSNREEFQNIRKDLYEIGKQSRLELSESLDKFNTSLSLHLTKINDTYANQLDSVSKNLSNLTNTNEEKLEKLREIVDGKLKEFQETLKSEMKSFSAEISKLTQSNEEKMEKIKEQVELKLKAVQDDNNVKLEQIRTTVDEKLHSTLEKRLGESFKLVSERLEKVHQGLGEMQSLATGVGDLKKVLTNVKTRGNWGEIQLGNLLEQLLTIDQYEQNVSTKKGSNDRVEFAIKLPSKHDDKGIVYLPIDSKFPLEDYQRLTEAQENGDMALANESLKQLEIRIKAEAKSINSKYIDPPHTTDFAIMFLPTEGLYSEVLRRPGLADTLQRDFRVVITGPTTLSALLNSLQMGFKTLAIEKRSSDVWQLLGAVKTEFGKFVTILEKTQKKLQEASNTIDTATKKTKTIERKLNKVQEIPVEEAQTLLESFAVEEEYV